MDALGWLKLQLEWGADEALDEQPVDRRVAAASGPAPAPGPALKSVPARAAAPPPIAVLTGAGALARAQALAAGAQTPAELRTALAGFDGCGLRATATNLVFSDGDPASRLVLLADVPGAAEDRAGVPFAGPGALFLDRMLASIGLQRAALLATSMLPWRPPGDRKPAEAEIQVCLPFLLRHLELLAPERILIFGGLAARVLLPGEPRRARSGWQALPVPGLAEPIPALAFPSVLHIQTTGVAKREAWGNLLRLERALASRTGHV